MQFELKNLGSGASILLNKKKWESYFLKEVDLGQVKATHNTTNYINLVGANVNSTSYNPRDISLSGFVSAANEQEMSKKKNLLNKLVNPKDELKLFFGDYALIMRADSSVSYATNEKENNGLLCRFLIQATAYMPFFTLRNPQIISDSASVGIPMFPLIIPEGRGRVFGIIPESTINNLLNNGDVECGFTVRFTATEGKARSPRIANNRTGKFIEVAVDMEQGDVLEVSTIPGNKYVSLIRGETEVNLFKAVRKSSSLDMTLAVGKNDLSITAGGSSSNLHVVITYTPLYLEVQ